MDKRIIFHVDVNNAFLSWTAILLLKKGYGTDIRKIAAVIGGDEEKRHGIVLAKSPVAKKYRIKTAETLYSARNKCPSLKVFSADYTWYYEQSRLFHHYLKQYSPNVLKYSIDEAFIDFTGTKYIYDDYIKLAYKIKDDIKKTFGFTVNVGVANNMLCAKMASDFLKPDKVHTLYDEEIKDKMWPLPIGNLFMVGKKTSAKLEELGIHTIFQLAHADLSFLTIHFKNQAVFLKNLANGVDLSKVEKKDSKSPSISVSETLPYDVEDQSILKNILFRQVSEVSRQLRSRLLYCNVVCIFYKNDRFETYSKQTKLDTAINSTEDIYRIILHLLDISWRKDAIRLIGVRLSDLVKNRKKQVSIFDDFSESIEEVDATFQKTLDEINHKFGKPLVMPASFKIIGKENSKRMK